MPRADRDAIAIQDLRHIVRMDALQRERGDPALLVRRQGRRTLTPGTSSKPLQGVLDDLVLVA